MSEPVEELTFDGMGFKFMAAYRAYSDRSDWVDGSLICTAVLEKPFEHEIEKEEFPISQACHAACPEYKRVLDVEKGADTPVVNASDMKVYVYLLKAMREHEEPRGELRPWPHPPWTSFPSNLNSEMRVRKHVTGYPLSSRPLNLPCPSERVYEGSAVSWNALALAIEALSWMELRRINERLALRRAAKQLNIRNPPTMRHAFRLIMEATRRKNVLDHIVAQALDDEGLKELNLGVRSFLRVYVSEVKYGGITYEEAVEMAGEARRILGSRELAPVEEALDLVHHLDINLQGLSCDEAIALRTFHPVWYVKYCSRLLGMEEALRLLQSPDPPNYIRINSLKGTEKEILESLRQEGLGLESEPDLGQAFRVVEQERPLAFMKAHVDGLFTVKDKASVLAGLVAAPKPGVTVLDVCAAPGGKTGHMAQLMENRGRILSMDSSERRLETWKREMARLGVKNAVPVLGDARKPKDFPDVEANVVLVDPPCTGTGTFNRIPSGKWRLTRRSISRMAIIQRRILDNCAEHVKQGGTLVYSTCSVTVEENELLIHDFLQSHTGFKLVEAEPRIGAPGLMGQVEAQRLYPHIHRCNGFYIAKLVRAKSSLAS